MAFLNTLHDDSTFLPCICYNLSEGLFYGTAYNLDTCRLVIVLSVESIESTYSSEVGCTTAWDSTFLYGSTCSTEGIIHAILLLLHLYFAWCTDIEYSYTTGELSQTLLELLTIVVRGRIGNLSLDLCCTLTDSFLIACTVYDGCIILVYGYLLCLTQHI